MNIKVQALSPKGYPVTLDLAFDDVTENEAEYFAGCIDYADALLSGAGCTPGHASIAPSNSSSNGSSAAAGQSGTAYQSPSGQWMCDPHGPMREGRHGWFCSKKVGPGDKDYCKAKAK